MNTQSQLGQIPLQIIFCDERLINHINQKSSQKYLSLSFGLSQIFS